MRRRLRREHGHDWVEVASAWHQLWTSSAWEQWSIVDELPAVACPVFAMHSLRDDLSPPLHVATIRDALPALRITWVETSAHDPHRVQRERFAADLCSLWRDAEHRDG
jgi:pimeloyl-ACP methyl ester carboxylesterase